MGPLTKYLLCIVLFTITEFCTAEENVVSARVESCAKCKLNSLPQVRAFLYDDLPKYENVEWKKIPGATPVLIFLDEDDKEVERYFLEYLDRDECNNLLKSKGFKLKEGKVNAEL